MARAFLLLFALVLSVPVRAAEQPTTGETIPVADLRPGQTGEVWTVFRGTKPEPFTVEVTGVIRNALGPGKSLIVCELTDERVQKMGATAGMSGSPLYIGGKLAGALSYQIQRFETVRYAGFTPAADLVEVQQRVAPSTSAPVADNTALPIRANDSFQPLRPVFTISGLSPAVADLFAPQFSALGLGPVALGGSLQSSSTDTTAPAVPPVAGDAVSVALTTGDITLAGTGTVSRVDGTHVTAFGHPMLSLGDVALPMCAAEIVTILPSSMQSIKLANTGNVIGTISQDRLSAVSGTLGPGPEMTEVEVNVSNIKGPARSLHFSVARHQQLTPVLVAAGVSQAILGSNDAGLSNGFILSSDVTFPAKQTLATRSLYAGPQGFQQGLGAFVKGLAQDLQNPYEKTFPHRVVFTVEPLEQNPAITLDLFQLSRTTAHAGETVEATISWRDYQGEAHRQTVGIPIDPAWVGKTLQVIFAPGDVIDDLTGRPQLISAAQLRSFDAYLAAQRDSRAEDGLFLTVVEKTRLFTDETVSVPDAPGSIERIAHAADEARFQHREAVLPLWERHLLDGKLSDAAIRRSLQVVE
ncbi:MAG: hypothetical protein JSS11_17745 [Verrucomicrobia bacterium]|nr:hypothetical protein [Verrucomicrobiota bacterium]